jgi:hypothetical protein
VTANATLEQTMEVQVRPQPPEWTDPGGDSIDQSKFYNSEDAARRLFAHTNTLRRLRHRIPHVVTLGGRYWYHKELVEAIRAELLNGNSLSTALVNIGVEPRE